MMQPPRLVRRCVLVVDDCPDTTLSLSLLLGCWGHQVHVAQEGQTALELADLYRPDVVLLDLRMPRMSGLELARRLRQNANLQHTQLAAVSGCCREMDRRCALEAGCDCLLAKPVEPEVLYRFLNARPSQALFCPIFG